MAEDAQRLFSPDAAAVLRAWGVSLSEAEGRVHEALAARTLRPDESQLRAAAAWLARLHGHYMEHLRFDQHALVAVLGEKSAMLMRLARRHVPALAVEFEGAASPLHAIEAAARFVPAADAANSPRVEDLRHAIAGLAPLDSPPAGADAAWHENRRQIRDLIVQDNPARFLTWPVVCNTMFMDDAAVAAPELKALQQRADYAMRWLPALREDALGAPGRTPLLDESSNNLIHHAYNLLQLELQTNTAVERLSSIVEFGGGYGSTARLAFRLGFRGVYVIFDLPEFSALQRFFLGSLGFPLKSTIHCVTSVEEVRNLLPRPDLFLATWSFSETPIGFRAGLMPIVRSARHLLLAYQHAFGENNNERYFADLAQELTGMTVRDYPIAHLPANRYFVAGPGGDSAGRAS